MGVVLEGQDAMAVCWLSECAPCRLHAGAQLSVVRGDGTESPGLVLGDCHIGQRAVAWLVSKCLVCNAHIQMSGLHYLRGSGKEPVMQRAEPSCMTSLQAWER